MRRLLENRFRVRSGRDALAKWVMMKPRDTLTPRCSYDAILSPEPLTCQLVFSTCPKMRRKNQAHGTESAAAPRFSGLRDGTIRYLARPLRKNEGVFPGSICEGSPAVNYEAIIG